MKYKKLALCIALLGLIFSQCMPIYVIEKSTKQPVEEAPAIDIIPIFFEGIERGNKFETWPDSTIMGYNDSIAYEGNVSLILKTTERGEARFCFPLLDIEPIKQKGALILYVKSDTEGNSFSIVIRNNWDAGGNKTETTKSFSTTTEWQEIMLPLLFFNDMGSYWDNGANAWLSAPFNWNAVYAINIGSDAGNAAKPFTLYIDNIYFISDFQAAGKSDPELAEMIMLKKMEKDPEKYLEKSMVYDFEEDNMGWVKGFGKTKEVKHTGINESRISEEHREGHGKGVLEALLDYKPSNYEKASIQLIGAQDWSDIKFFEFDVYMPADGIEINAVPFVQSGGWKWSQGDISAATLKPGEWERIQCGLHTLPDLKPSSIEAFGILMHGQIKSAYKGPVYIDNWHKYVMGLKPVLLSQEEYIKAGQQFTPVDISKTANMGFMDEEEDDGKGGWIDQGINDMREFAYKGETKFLDIPFNIIDPDKNSGKSCIILRGQDIETLPNRVEIDINNAASGIYFLHSADSWSPETAGRYTFVYENGQQWTTPVRFGHEIIDWWAEQEFNSDMIRTVWTGSNPQKDKVSLYLYGWKNPYPDLKISKIIAETDGDKSYIMIVGLTLTDKGPYFPQLSPESN